jgi:hypothetical protein
VALWRVAATPLFQVVLLLWSPSLENSAVETRFEVLALVLQT